MNMLSPSPPPHYRSGGQGSIDYLLLIAGAILVVTVILLLLFTSVIPQAEQILKDNISQAGQLQTLPGSNPNNPPPAYAGPLFMDWSNVPSVDYASFNIDNNPPLPPITASPSKTISNIRLINSGSASITLVQFTPQFTFSSVSQQPTLITSMVWTPISGGGSPFSLSNILLNQPFDFSTPLVLSPDDEWRIDVTLDNNVFSVVHAYYFYPEESNHVLQFLFSDNTNAIHRPDALVEFLVYEKKKAVGLDDFIHTCNGLSQKLGSDTVALIITDWCAVTKGACSYVVDLGYSTAFSFPAIIPLSAHVLDARYFMTQLDSKAAFSDSGGSSSVVSYEDSDPYHVIKENVSCNPILFDSVADDIIFPEEYANEVAAVFPDDLDGDLGEVKRFNFNGVIQPGEGDLFFSLVGDDPPTGGYYGITEGWRQWQTGFSSGQSTPSPFLIVRYALPN